MYAIVIFSQGPLIKRANTHRRFLSAHPLLTKIDFLIEGVGWEEIAEGRKCREDHVKPCEQNLISSHTKGVPVYNYTPQQLTFSYKEWSGDNVMKLGLREIQKQ